jgi:hypothetical protein
MEKSDLLFWVKVQLVAWFLFAIVIAMRVMRNNMKPIGQ